MALLPCSLAPIFDGGFPLADGRVYVWLAGTTQAAPVFLDPDYATPAPNPCPVDGYGRLPGLYAAGALRLRFEDSRGQGYGEVARVVLVDPVVSETDGGAVDPARAQTGDVKARYGTGPHAGWVPMRGRSIGSAASGATERANADTRALYLHLWDADPSLPVSGGRGIEAVADFAADKQLTLPNAIRRGLMGLDDVGGTAFQGVRFDGDGSGAKLGSTGGDATRALVEANLAPHVHTASVTIEQAGAHAHTADVSEVPPHNHGLVYTTTLVAAGSGASVLNSVTANGTGVGSGTAQNASFKPSATIAQAGAHAHTASATIAATGQGQAFSLIDPFMLVTFYLKL